MKRFLIALTTGLMLASVTACTLNYAKSNPTPYPTLSEQASPTALVALPATAASAPAGTPVVAPAGQGSQVDYAPTATVSGIVQGAPSGPYAVIQVAAGEALNLRSGPGVTYLAIGSFPSNTSTIMRTGPSASTAGYLWVEVQNPAGGTGWVNSAYLTEYVHPSNFCADSRASALVLSFGEALKSSNGTTLAGMVSPVGGWTVRLWRNGNAVVFDRAHVQWIFVSTYGHHWGAAPGSGQDTVGAVHEVVLPKLLDVFNATAPVYSITCNTVQAGGASYDTSWPSNMVNMNYFSVYKPGPAGNELAWRTLLIGIEYVGGQPYIYSTTQMEWEP
jgi:hypothetical protein